MIRLAPIGLVAALALSGCVAPQQPVQLQPGTTVYGSSEVGRALPTTTSCRVASVRGVMIAGDSYADERRAQSRRTTGTLLGGAAGAALGSQIGNGDGRRAATVIGAIVGASVGNAAAENADAQARLRRGLEYTIDVPGDRRVIVQEYDGVILPRGSACRLIGRGNDIRVLPL